MMAIDGADPEAIEEAGITEYLSKYLGRSPEERLIALMGITGAQLLQLAGIPTLSSRHSVPWRRWEPKGYLDAEKDSLEQKRKESSDEEVSSEARLEDLCSRGYPDYGKEDMVEKLTDHALRQLDQTGMMRLLREVENRDIAVAMKLLSGEATKNVFDAMSHRLALMIAEDVEFMGPVRAKDIEEACVKVMKTLVKMIDAGEIVCEEGQAYKLFMQLFAAESEAAGTLQSKQQKSEKELSDLLKEFADSRNKSNRLID